MKAQIVKASNVDFFDWSALPSGEKLKLFYEPLIKNNSGIYISNSNNFIALICINGKVLPLSMESTNKVDNHSYVFKLVTSFFKDCYQNVVRSKKHSRLKRALLRRLLLLYRKFFLWRRRNDTLVNINVYGLTTGLYPDLSKEEWMAVMGLVRQQFGGHAILYRGMNTDCNSKDIQWLMQLGLQRIPYRKPLLFQPAAQRHIVKRSFVRDRVFCANDSTCYWDEKSALNAAEQEQVLKYYSDLYLDKYDVHSPRYTLLFIERSMKSEILHYLLLRRRADKAIVGVQAIQVVNKVMNSPFLGYDTTADRKCGYYRMMNIKTMEMAIENGFVLNMSSGAEEFKKLRGALHSRDYHLIDFSTMCYFKRAHWWLMAAISKRLLKL